MAIIMALIPVVSWLKNSVRMKTCIKGTSSTYPLPFFPKLYSADSSLDKVELKAFLNKANLWQIPQSSADLLDSPSTLTELKETLLTMKTGKSLGLDSIPHEDFSGHN